MRRYGLREHHEAVVIMGARSAFRCARSGNAIELGHALLAGTSTISELVEPVFALDVLASAGKHADVAVIGRVLDLLRQRANSDPARGLVELRAWIAPQERDCNALRQAERPEPAPVASPHQVSLADRRAQMDDEITALRAELSELRARLAALADGGGRGQLEQSGGRRSLLKLAGTAAIGAAAAGVASARPAAAMTGDQFLVGKRNFADLPTVLSYGSGAAQNSSSGGYPDPLLFVNASDHADSVGVMASGKVVGLLGSGESAGVWSFGRDYGYVSIVSKKADFKFGLLEAGANAPKTAPPSRTDAHQKGELDADGDGNLWFCVAHGAPGTWRKLAGPDAAGTFHPLPPGRVYDSREAAPSPGELAGGQNRTISVADRRNVAGGSVATANFVPAGATAVSANVTIVSTVGSGYLAINPGGDFEVRASTINWSAPGQILANGVTLTLDANRQLAAIAGGAGATHFLVDILGFWR